MSVVVVKEAPRSGSSPTTVALKIVGLCPGSDLKEHTTMAEGQMMTPADVVALRSTNPLEGVNKEIGRRSDVVGIFPNGASAIRLAAPC